MYEHNKNDRNLGVEKKKTFQKNIETKHKKATCNAKWNKPWRVEPAGNESKLNTLKSDTTVGGWSKANLAQFSMR